MNVYIYIIRYTYTLQISYCRSIQVDRIPVVICCICLKSPVALGFALLMRPNIVMLASHNGATAAVSGLKMQASMIHYVLPR